MKRKVKRKTGYTFTQSKTIVPKQDDKSALIDLVITSTMDKGTKIKLLEALL